MGYKTVRKEVLRESWVYTDVRCDRCNAKLEPVFHSDNNKDGWGYLTAARAFMLTLNGYYGGFFDCDKDPTILLCKDCANLLCEQWPIFTKAIEQQ